MSDVVVITSGKGGVGKSTCAANLGAALARMGRQCLLIDMDMGLRSLDILLGMENMMVYDLADIAQGMCRIRQAILVHPSIPNLALIGASGVYGADALSAAQMDNVVAALKPRFDSILIDSPAGLGRGFRNAVYAADRAILVGTLDAVMLRDAERLVGLMQQQGFARPDLILNRVTAAQLGEQSTATLETFEERLGTRLLGIVPEEARMRAFAEWGQVAERDCAAGRAFSRIARRIAGENVPIETPRTEGVFRRVLRAIKND